MFSLMETTSDEAIEQWFTMCKRMTTTGADLIFKDDPLSVATLGIKLGKGFVFNRHQIDEVRTSYTLHTPMTQKRQHITSKSQSPPQKTDSLS